MGLRGVPVGDLLLQRQAAAILGFGHEIRVEAPVRHGQPEGRFRVVGDESFLSAACVTRRLVR